MKGTANNRLADSFGPQASHPQPESSENGRMRIMILVALLLSAAVALSASEVADGALNVTSNGVQVPIGKFFLIRDGNKYAAVKLTSEISKGDGGCEYVWYFQTDGSGVFTNNSAENGKARVFEKYRRVKKTDTGWEVKNDGGVLHIVCKSIKVEWSLSNWIYFDSPIGPVVIAVSDTDDINKINFLASTLIWHSRKEEEVSQPTNAPYSQPAPQVEKR